MADSQRIKSYKLRIRTCGYNFQFLKLRISESKGCLQTLPSVATSTKLIFNCQLSILNYLYIALVPASNVFIMSDTMVMGPTPPGTGVM